MKKSTRESLHLYKVVARETKKVEEMLFNRAVKALRVAELYIQQASLDEADVSKSFRFYTPEKRRSLAANNLKTARTNYLGVLRSMGSTQGSDIVAISDPAHIEFDRRYKAAVKAATPEEEK